MNRKAKCPQCLTWNTPKKNEAFICSYCGLALSGKALMWSVPSEKEKPSDKGAAE